MTDSLQKTHLLDILKQIGLSDNESAVYLATLSLGPSKIITIARNSSVKRTTIYAVIESLRQKGLVRKDARGFKNLFVAEDPTRLETMLEERNRTLQTFLPQLRALYNLEGSDSVIKYYDTPEGVRNVWRQLLSDLRNGDDYYVYGDPERYDHDNESFFKDFIKKRVQIKLNAKLLLVNSVLADEYRLHANNFGEQVKLLPVGVSFDTNTCITDTRMIMQQIIEPHLTIVIENKSIIGMQKRLFELLWNTSQ